MAAGRGSILCVPSRFRASKRNPCCSVIIKNYFASCAFPVYNRGMDFLKTTAGMVEFLTGVYGENCEVVLQDLREGKNRILAIANGHISGRTVGDPLTGLALRLVNQGVWKTRDYICNYEGKGSDNRPLRSSTFFIKDEGRLLGMLTINVDCGKYLRLSESILELAGLRGGPGPKESETANFYSDMEEIIKSVLDESGVKDSFTLEERLAIIEKLIDQGVFLLKGSVSAVAEKLKCSEASMYRYMAMVNKRRARAGR